MLKTGYRTFVFVRFRRDHRQQPTHNCRSAIILGFPKPDSRDMLHTTPDGHSIQISEWQPTHGKRTSILASPTGSTVQKETFKHKINSESLWSLFITKSSVEIFFIYDPINRRLNLSEGRGRKSRIPYKRKAGLPNMTSLKSEEGVWFFCAKYDLCQDARTGCFNLRS